MASILIIDDDESILRLLEEILIYEGFKVLTATDGTQGMKLFNENQVDLVITDIILPEKIGFDIITEMKKTHPEIKIIAISGMELGMIKSCLKTARFSGAEYTFAKPFKTRNLLMAVHELLKQKKDSKHFSELAV